MRSLASVTFWPPEGFTYEQQSGADAAVVIDVVRPRVVLFQLIVLPPFPSGRSLDHDFAMAWERHIAKNFGRRPSADELFEIIAKRVIPVDTPVRRGTVWEF